MKDTVSRGAAIAPMAHRRGRVFLSTGRMLYVGPGYATGSHAHHSIQISIALSAPLRMRIEGRTIDAHVVIVPPRARHELDASGTDVALLHVEPDSLEGRALSERAALASPSMEARIRAIAPLAREARSATAAQRFFDAVMHAIEDGDEPHEPVRPRHPAVRRALDVVATRLDEPVVRLGPLARELRLSPRWLSELFRAQVGLPLRRYVLWLRLRRAGDELTSGATLGQAAHAAGFADAAHLSRAFRAAFGSSPSQFLTLVGDITSDRRNVQGGSRRAT